MSHAEVSFERDIEFLPKPYAPASYSGEHDTFEGIPHYKVYLDETFMPKGINMNDVFEEVHPDDEDVDQMHQRVRLYVWANYRGKLRGKHKCRIQNVDVRATRDRRRQAKIDEIKEMECQEGWGLF